MTLQIVSRASGVLGCLCVMGMTAMSHAQVYETNLITNPGFENGPASADGSTVVTPTGWNSIGSATVVPYSAGGQFPSVSSPGPDDRGNQFVAGGPTAALSQLFQTIDLSAYATTIDAGGVGFRLSGYLGGFGTQDDIARVIVVWADANANSLRTDTLVGPSAAVRGGVTGLSQYWTVSGVPANTRQVLVTITLARVIGPYNNAYVDNVGLELTRRCDGIDFNNDESLFDPTDIDAFLSVFSEGDCIPASATCNDIDFNNDGSVFDPADIDSFLSVFSEGPCVQ
jgi:hypothetical protein